MRGRRGAVLRAIMGATVALGMTAVTGDGEACGLMLRAPTGPSAVREALPLAKSTSEDDRREALRMITRNAELSALDFDAFPDASTLRARLILTQLIVGSQGTVGPRQHAEENLAVASRLLDSLQEHWGPLDPRVRLWRALNAEATGDLPPHLVQFELELLSGQQLMSHAAGWAALARLRGAGKLADEATDRCWATSFDPERECALSVTPAS